MIADRPTDQPRRAQRLCAAARTATATALVSLALLVGGAFPLHAFAADATAQAGADSQVVAIEQAAAASTSTSTSGSTSGSGSALVPTSTSDSASPSKEALVERDSIKTNVTLSEKEQRADAILTAYREEVEASFNKYTLYRMDVLNDSAIWETSLYQVLLTMPKGADLHNHTDAYLPLDELVAFLETRDDVLISVEPDTYCTLYARDGGSEIPEGACTVGEALESGLVTLEDLKNAWTISGAGSTDDVWGHFESIFTAQDALTGTPELVQAYYTAAFTYYAEHNVMRVELRAFFAGTEEGEVAVAKALRQAYYDVRDAYPDFTVSVIASAGKTMSRDSEISSIMANSLAVYEQVKDEYDPDDVKDFVIGIDLVGEEDASLPLEEYADLLEDIVERHPGLNLYLHAGESLDPENDNVIDAYLLGARRIGHGFNLYRYPELLELVKEEGIAIEVCPISNQTLRYDYDLRLHPAYEYLKRGVAIVICSDDPAYQEHSILTDDYYAVTVAWKLSLAEVKQLVLNSWEYSALSDADREKAVAAWEVAWDAWIDEVIEGAEGAEWAEAA